MERQSIFVLVLALLFAACQGDNKNTGASRETEAQPSKTEEQTAPLASPPWTAEFNEQKQELELRQHYPDREDIPVEDIVSSLNKKYPQIPLQMLGMHGDTLAVTITDATALSREMGSAGAEAYLAEATFSLTEARGVKAVAFKFEEGDHAMPGVYTRESFQDFN
ncbi:hypothetical protein [Pedobacter sp. SYSU D00535]|uniref:hypothetical protein n=1 Tax=Pedobacter sp. SYSU D00535 TaxID=2810308 RepID=UPI001A9587F9|nr:hypothetical protein [Pedobacter sp. SYSU D00535]